MALSSPTPQHLGARTAIPPEKVEGPSGTGGPFSSNSVKFKRSSAFAKNVSPRKKKHQNHHEGSLFSNQCCFLKDVCIYIDLNTL